MTFTYAPQAGVRWAYLISAVVCLLLLAFLVAGWLIGRRRQVVDERSATLPEDRRQRIPLARAAGLAFIATLPLSFLFAARASVVIFPLLTVILWRAVRSRLLTSIAAGLLGVVVPVMYAAISPKNRGGYNFEYSRELIWAHWVGVLAIVLLMVVCWRALAAARSGFAQPRAGGQAHGGELPALARGGVAGDPLERDSVGKRGGL